MRIPDPEDFHVKYEALIVLGAMLMLPMLAFGQNLVTNALTIAGFVIAVSAAIVEYVEYRGRKRAPDLPTEGPE